ncbi:MAG: UvrD-helicase domain-containing protein [Thermoactinomyces sp.]
MSVVALQDTFLEAYSRIPKGEQKRIYKLIDALRLNLQTKGLNLERMKEALDPNVYSVRLSDSYRVILVRPQHDDVFLLVWIDQHDKAYRWIKRKRFIPNKKTRTLQMWDMEEVKESERLTGPLPVPAGQRLFDCVTDEQLYQLGVIPEFIPIVRKIETLDDFEIYKPVFPNDTCEYLSFIAQGDSPEEVLQVMRELERESDATDKKDFTVSDAIVSPASSRTIMVAARDHKLNEQLQEVLDQPLERWRVFLHPRQKTVVEKNYRGPVRVLGGAGTGKTVIAMHRARYLIRHFLQDGERVLFTTFTRTLAQNLKHLLSTMCRPEEMERIDVIHIDALAKRIAEKGKGSAVTIIRENKLRLLWKEAMTRGGWDSADYAFLRAEYDRVIQLNGIETWQEYLSTPRVGRKTSISRSMRKQIWDTVSYVVEKKKENGWYEYTDVLREARKWLEANPTQTLFQYRAAIIDEAQDMHQEGFRLLRALIPEAENDLFIVGDAHQRIYSRKVVLGRCGIHVRGRRSLRLNVNYRTTEQIRQKAIEVIRKMEFDDLDGGVDHGNDISLLSGTAPVIRSFPNSTEEKEFILSRIRKLLASGVKRDEIAILLPTNDGLTVMVNKLNKNNLPAGNLSAKNNPGRPKLQCGTMHNSKGLEFRVVFIAEANEDNLPNSGVLKSKQNEPDELEAYLNEQRSLLYVAMTRAREKVYITSYGPLTPFLSDLPNN